MAYHNFFQMRGCELQLFSLCKALQHYDVEIVLVQVATKNTLPIDLIDGVRVLTVPRIISLFKATPFYLRFLFRFKLGRTPDLFHCHAILCRFAEQVLWFAQKRKIPTLLKTTTEGEVADLKRRIQEGNRSILSWALALLNGESLFSKIKQLELILYGKNRFATYSNVSYHLSINPNITAELKQFSIHPSRIASIPNGVDIQRFKPITEPEKQTLKKTLNLPESQQFIVMTAHFEERKRYRDLIYAWHQLASDFPHYTLLLIGEGDTHSQCKQLVQDLGLSSSVLFTGLQCAVEQFLQVADLFIFTSEREGLPNAVLEAMSSALPVIGTSIGGIQEIIEPYQNGLLFPPGEISALVSLSRYVLEHPEHAKKMGAAARQTIMNTYSFEKIAPQFFNLYQNLTLSKRSPTSSLSSG